MRRLLGLLLATLAMAGLIAIGTVLPASAMPYTKTPCRVPSGPPEGSNRYAWPLDMVCVNKTWKNYYNDAWSHRKKTTRVPFPSKKARSVKKYQHEFYVVYVVRQKPAWKKGEPTSIYKFGITRVAPWQDRANVGRRKCDTLATTCKIDWVASTKGWYTARMVEASLIQKYRKKTGFCPPGQLVSCS